MWLGFFGAKTNENPRFVKHKQLRSSGKSVQSEKRFIRNLFIVMESGAPVLGLAESIH